MSTPSTFGNGRVEWRDDEGRLHREDGPAVEHANGSEKWYRHGGATARALRPAST